MKPIASDPNVGFDTSESILGWYKELTSRVRSTPNVTKRHPVGEPFHGVMLQLHRAREPIQVLREVIHLVVFRREAAEEPKLGRAEVAGVGEDRRPDAAAEARLGAEVGRPRDVAGPSR